MQAACYGRAFCEAERFPKKRMVEVCRQLRLLNALQAPDVSIPLSFAQLQACGPEAVLKRLVKGHKHLLAYRAAVMLSLNPSEVPSGLWFHYLYALCTQRKSELKRRQNFIHATV